MIILDTNVVSELRKAAAGRCDPAVAQWAEQQAPETLYLSVISVLELELGIAVQDDFLVLELDGRARALEIRTCSDLARDLIDRIFHFNEIGFKNGVKRRHAGGLAKR